MKSIKVTYGKNLFGQFEVCLYHDVLKEPIGIAHNDPAEIRREVEQLLVITVKTLLAKYLTVVRKTKGNYLVGDDRQRLDDLNEVKSYFTRRMRLATVQRTLKAHLLNVSALLPGKRSRFYPSQLLKYEFFQAVCAFQLEQIDRLATVPSKPGYNV